VLQAANTGITSLQSLIDSAKSIANQALQTTVGYSTKSNVSTTIAGATAANLLGTTTFTSATASGNVLYTGAAGGTTAATSAKTLGGTSGVFTGAATNDNTATPVAITTGTKIYGASAALTTLANTKFADGDVFTINGKTVTVKSAATPSAATLASGTTGVSGNVVTDGGGNSTVYLNANTTVGDFLKAFDLASGVQVASNSSGTATVSTASGQTVSTINGSGAILLQSTTGQDLTLTGKADDLAALGLTSSTGGGNATVQAFRTSSATSLNTFIQAGSSLNVDGHVITFKDAATPATAAVASGSGVSGNVVTDGSGNSTVYLQSATLADVLNAIDLATGVQTASNSGGAATLSTATGQTNSSVNASGQLKLSTGVNADLSITGTGNALTVLGLAGNTGTATAFTAARTSGVGGISGKTLTFSSFNGGTAVNVTFGSGTGQISTLNQLNTVLQANNQTATIDANGNLTISTSNDYASSTLGSAAAGGAIGGTLTSALTFSTASAPVADPNAQAARSGLVAQYNNILQQINTTSQDASFNGVNLLNGDQLKLVFDETGKSSLNITGVTYNSTGLGLAALTTGVDFIDNAATNKVLSNLNTASSTLRSEASSLGSNLSIVQVRQDFNKSLINVLQTGSSNLTLADTNEEAANSQALSTRQSIAVSALSLANQSQQSVLQLLR
jgi:flagellin